MISLYIDDKLNDEHKKMVEEHFALCPECYQKYLNIKSIIENLKLSYEKVLEKVEPIETVNLFNIREYEKFYRNISAYMDNELSNQESIDFRKYLLKSKSARSDLKNMYILQNQIKDSFTKCISHSRVNLAKKIVKKIKRENQTTEQIIAKVAILLGLAIFTGSCLYFFKNNDKHEPPKIKKEKNFISVKVVYNKTNYYL